MSLTTYEIELVLKQAKTEHEMMLAQLSNGNVKSASASAHLIIGVANYDDEIKAEMPYAILADAERVAAMEA